MKRHHEMKEVIIEVLKWTLVLFLLWPAWSAGTGRLSLLRVVAGIVLLVIFTGKMLYDYLIRDYMRQRNLSPQKDIIGFLGIILGIALIVGAALFLLALFIIRFASADRPV